MGRKQKGEALSAAAASRRNGARSRGPRTAAGKAVASRNALKHGLFSRPAVGVDLPGSPELVAALAGMDDDARRSSGAQEAQFADWQLIQATHLLARLDSEIDTLLAADVPAPRRLAELLDERARMGRYQRRFRGTRDRLLRELMGCAAYDREAE